MTTSTRINVHLASQFGISRRKADRLIADGKVRVNGKTARLGQIINPISDEIVLNESTITAKSQKEISIAINKPPGYLSTRSDPFGRKTVLELLPSQFKHLKLVGRLDYQSEGLLLLSNNGTFIHEHTHPKFLKEKEYLVKFNEPISEALIRAFKNGIELKEGIAKVDTLNQISQNEIRITIHQGWNRQVRRMAAKYEYDVTKLVRTRIGEYRLGVLKPGNWKILPRL